MSIILFWSPFHGQGQTSNLHAFALCANFIYGKSVLMMQTQFEKNNLESPFVGRNVDKKNNADNPLFQDIGLDMAVTFSNLNKLTRNILESCCISFRDASLLLMPGTEIKNRESFKRDIGNAVGRMIRKADECVDMVVIDANSGDDELSFRLMPLADMIVVNLSQRRYVLDKFFLDYGDYFINKPVFYLFGNYDDNSSYNIFNCRRKYKKYLNRTNSGVIPYSTKYLDAQNESRLIDFMQDGMNRYELNGAKKYLWMMKNRLQERKYILDETEYFFNMVKLSMENMLEMLKINRPETVGRNMHEYA